MIQQNPIHVAHPSSVHATPHAEVWLHHSVQTNKEMVLANHLSNFPSLKEFLPIPIHQNIQHVQLSTD